MKKLSMSIVLFGVLNCMTNPLISLSCDTSGSEGGNCFDDEVTVTSVKASSCKENAGIIRVTVTSNPGPLTVTIDLVGPVENPTPHAPIVFMVPANSSETRQFTGLSNGNYTVTVTINDSSDESTCITTCTDVIVNNKLRKCRPIISACCPC